MTDSSPSPVTAEPGRFSIRLPHWGWFLLAATVLVIGFVAATSYPADSDDGWPTIDAVVLILAPFGIWLPIRWAGRRTGRLGTLSVCVALVIGVGVMSIWLPYALEQQEVHSIEQWGGCVERNKDDFYWRREFMGRTRVWKFKVVEPVAYVNLAGTKVTDAEIAQLSRLTSLRQLNLSQTAVTDAGLAHLSGLKNLSELYLGTAAVTDSGLAHLSGLSNLRWLSLYGTELTDAGLIHLIGMTNLDELWLNNTKVTDSSLAHLSRLKNLRVLWLLGTLVTDDGIRELQKALPQCTIHWY